MDVRVQTAFCMFLLCYFEAVFSAQGHRYHAGLKTNLAFRNFSFNHHSNYPLYMMQLYRSFRTTDSSSSLAVNTINTPGDILPAHNSDSVLNLMAKGEQTELCQYCTFKTDGMDGVLFFIYH